MLIIVLTPITEDYPKPVYEFPENAHIIIVTLLQVQVDNLEDTLLQATHWRTTKFQTGPYIR